MLLLLVVVLLLLLLLLLPLVLLPCLLVHLLTVCRRHCLSSHTRPRRTVLFLVQLNHLSVTQIGTLLAVYYDPAADNDVSAPAPQLT